MDFNRYCKECGHKVEFQYGETTAYCPVCDKEIEHKDAIAGYTLNARIKQIKAMHELMLNGNNESLYMSWIYLVPDCPNEDDFKYIAMNDSSYNECWDKFLRLVQKNGMRW